MSLKYEPASVPQHISGGVPRDDDVGVGTEARDGVDVRLEERKLHGLVLRKHLPDNQVMSVSEALEFGKF